MDQTAMTELLKGVLEGCVMQILANGQSYGYQIVRVLNGAGFASVSEGTVYPILVRLEKKQLVDVSRVPSELGPPRRVYELNAAGQVALAGFWERWQFIASRLESIKDNKEQNNG